MLKEIPLKTAAGATLRVLGDVIAAAAKYALTGFMVLISIWLIGRILEGLQGYCLFDPVVTRWFGISIWILLAGWIIGRGIGSVKALSQADKRWRALVCWAFFLIIVTAVFIDREGFQISSSGLFAIFSGSAESAQQDSFLLFKFHPLNPMLAVNVIASELGGTENFESLVSYAWSWNIIFAFFIWSLIYGIFLLMQKNHVWSKTIHLILAACGLGFLLVSKSVISFPMPWHMIYLHTSALILLVFQVLLTYANIRSFASPKKENPEEERDPFSTRSEKEKTEAKKSFLGLPPSALKVTLFLFIILPILADLHNQSKLAASSTKLMTEMAGHEKVISDLVTVASISVRTGPAMGEEVVGVLPKGTRVPVVAKKYEWVNIGENKWVVEKFLRPLEQDQSAL